MNQKGQAYSVFKLLIAAIVAMAILGILVPIIMQVMGIITKDPVAETKTLLSDLINNPGTLRHTDPVTFQPQTTLAADSLTERTSLSPEQICFGLGELENIASEDFEVIGGSGTSPKIYYSGNQARTVKIAVLCQRGPEALSTDLSDYEMPDYESCGCGDDQTCCAVILEPA